MKALVIGGAGYIGSHLVYELIRDNHEVIIFDNLSTGNKNNVHSKAKFYLGDITNNEDLVSLLSKESNFDIVFHFAAKLIVSESMEKPLEYYYNNVEGVRTLLENMNKFKLNKIIFSSTAAVYGNPIKDICEEEDLTNPINPYGETKLICEKMIKWCSHVNNLKYGIFRYFNVAGGDKSLEIGYDYHNPNKTHLIPIITEVALGIREKLNVYGNDYDTRDGTCIRDYIHVTDLAKAHLLGAKHLLSGNDSFLLNLGSNNGYSVLEIIEATKKYAQINYEISKRREGDPSILIASNQKAKEVLNWRPELKLDDIIKTSIEYCKKIL